MKINGKELDQILDEHKKWLDGEEGGSRASLCDANLWGANLNGANLRGANLWDANLNGANLWGANLRDANLRDANLSGANLNGANLCDANLWGANLRDANLSGANLSGANLNGASGNRSEIKSLFVSEKYAITYTFKHLQIGCEKHEIEDWWKFDDDRIKQMGGEAVIEFWDEWKDTIKMIIEKSPAKDTKYEESNYDN